MVDPTPQTPKSHRSLNLTISGITRSVEQIATSNQNKLSEYRDLGIELASAPSSDIERQLNDSEIKLIADASRENYLQVSGNVAKDKAITNFIQNGNTPVLIEDTSLWLDCAPTVTGISIKNWCVNDNTLKLLCYLAKHTNKFGALAVIALSVSLDGVNSEVWTSSVEGEIATEPRGSNGFGWDKIFIPEPKKQYEKYNYAKTWAEMTTHEKLHEFPLRGIAVKDLLASANKL